MLEIIESCVSGSSNPGIMGLFPRLKHREILVRLRERQPLPRVMELIMGMGEEAEKAGKGQEGSPGNVL